MSDPTVLIRVGLPDATWVEAQEILSAQRWREEEGLGILAGYGFGVHVESYAEDVLYAFGAARGELSSLRHRTFMADDAVRNLKMNLTGLRASVQQARRSLERLQEEVAALRMRAQLVGVDPGDVKPAQPGAQDRLFAFFERAREKDRRHE
jgi:hypothetical protein